MKRSDFGKCLAMASLAGIRNVDNGLEVPMGEVEAARVVGIQRWMSGKEIYLVTLLVDLWGEAC
jgi:uncharacterized protein YunC (DUF1805 family)